jgi:hypothetical protein
MGIISSQVALSRKQDFEITINMQSIYGVHLGHEGEKAELGKKKKLRYRTDPTAVMASPRENGPSELFQVG